MMKKNIIIGILLLSIAPLLNGMKEEEKSFFCSFDKEVNADDTKLQMYIKLPLVIHLSVHASQSEFPQEPLQEFLQRFKEGKIIQKEEDKTPYAIMTEKDVYYRLMSYVQQYKNGSGQSVINGKEIDLQLVGFETEEDVRETNKEYKRRESRLKNGEEVEDRCCNRSSGITISMAWNKNIEDMDKDHHEKMVKSFEELLNS